MAAALVVAGRVRNPPKPQRFDDRMHVRNVEPVRTKSCFTGLGAIVPTSGQRSIDAIEVYENKSHFLPICRGVTTLMQGNAYKPTCKLRHVYE
jgi:hypothetical protein